MDKKEFDILKQKSDSELNKNLVELRDKLWDLKENLLKGKVKNIQEVHTVKKDIARTMTILSSRKTLWK